MEKYKFAEIILPLALKGTFTYMVPENLVSSTLPGKRVSVQFGKRKIYTGIVHSLHNNEPSFEEVKSIITVLDDIPLINSTQLKFWDWLAGYYMCTPGEVLKAALPQGLKLESESRIICNENSVDKALLSDSERDLYEQLERDKAATIQKLGNISGVENIHLSLQKLIDKKAVFIEERLKDNYSPQKKLVYSLSKEFITSGKEPSLDQHLSRSPRQREIVEFLLRNEQQLISKEQLAKEFSVSAAESLVKKNILIKREELVLRMQGVDGGEDLNHGLSPVQAKALSSVKAQFEEKNVVLLHGVTSSGKTEIYTELIRETLDRGKQVLYLLPEIALTTQIIERLRRVFGEKAGVYHSRFNDSERVDIYRRLAGGRQTEYGLILGVRSAVFLPFRDPGLIIVDEEHENTFKQQDPAPRYHARDAAIILASFYNAKVLLGTATPSIESSFNARSGKFGYVSISERFGGVMMPEIKVADLRKARLKKQMRSVFTPLLMDHISATLQKGKQVILFQNRRGYSTYLECGDCGFIPRCEKCDVSLTFHRYSNRLICHYCGHSQKLPQACPDCGSTRLAMRGFGTERIEDEVDSLFPGTKIARLDQDSTRSRKAYERILGEFSDGKTQILVGTQMLSKGLDFDNVELVGILNADQMMNYPDFRAYERSFQLMSQVSGRAGRKKERGIVVIQASDPDHSLIQQVINYDYEGFYQGQYGERQVFNYPPFVRLIKVVVKSRDLNDGKIAAEILGTELKKVFGRRVLGPQAPVVGRIKLWHLQHLILKIEKEASFYKARKYLLQSMEKAQKNEVFKKVRINLDVDPM